MNQNQIVAAVVTTTGAAYLALTLVNNRQKRQLKKLEETRKSIARIRKMTEAFVSSMDSDEMRKLAKLAEDITYDQAFNNIVKNY